MHVFHLYIPDHVEPSAGSTKSQIPNNTVECGIWIIRDHIDPPFWIMLIPIPDDTDLKDIPV
jgi:hypothetical protein